MEKDLTEKSSIEETAEQKLSRMEAEQASVETANESVEPKIEEQGNEVGEKTPPTAEKVESKTSPKEKIDARADAEKPVKESKKPVEEQPVALNEDEKKKFNAYLKLTQSKYGADLGKRLIRWDAIKEAEKNFELQQQKKIEAFNKEVAAFKAEQEATKPTPEKYELFAAKQLQLAEQKEQEADKADKNGDFDKAETLRDEAKFAKRDAQAAYKSAEYVRNNPPKTVQQNKEQFVAQQKEWISKAAIDFPEFAKQNSSVQVSAAELYKQMIQQHPEIENLPAVVYYCARIANAEAASARVPILTKELEETKSKLEELNLMTNPTPVGGVTKLPKNNKSFEAMSSEEQFEALRSDAAVMS